MRVGQLVKFNLSNHNNSRVAALLYYQLYRSLAFEYTSNLSRLFKGKYHSNYYVRVMK